jgi:hypothetical protein
LVTFILRSDAIFGHAGRAFQEGGRPQNRPRTAEDKQTELTVLPVAASDAVRMSLGSQFLVRAGGGGFVCELTLAPDVGTDDEPGVLLSALPGRELVVQARAATWIAEDMVHERQVLLAYDGMPGERLGDGWLLPRQVSVVHSADGRMWMYINFLRWEPGLLLPDSHHQGWHGHFDSRRCRTPR